MALRLHQNNCERRLEQLAESANNADAWHNLRIIATYQRREREAIERFERVVAVKPGEEFARRQLVRLRAGAGDIAGALREFMELARIPKERLTAALLRTQLRRRLRKTVERTAGRFCRGRFLPVVQGRFSIYVFRRGIIRHAKSGRIRGAMAPFPFRAPKTEHDDETDDETETRSGD